MMRTGVPTCLAIAALILGANRAIAQFPGNPVGGAQRPTFSPYLNLNRPGTSPAVNYFGIVRPQFQALSTFQSLEQQSATNRQAIADNGNSATGLPTTGKQVYFLNTGGYFMNLSPNQGQGGSGSSFGSFGGGMSGSAGVRNKPVSTSRR